MVMITSMLKKEKTLNYTNTLREEWLSGELQIKWRGQYPGIFDKEDLRIAKFTQRRRHFGEWLAATYYADKGYQVMVERYFSKRKHKERIATLSRYFPAVADFILKTKGRRQPPDLFVYKTKPKQFFFVEVKLERDQRKSIQDDFFEEIARRLGCEIRILRIKKPEL